MNSDDFVKHFSAKVWVPLENGNMAEVGTGLPISKKHILTSLHVLASGKRNYGKSIRVEFPKQPTDVSGETPSFLVKETHIFDDCKMAVLELKDELPYDFEPLLVARDASEIVSKSEWKATGYPKYSENSEDPLEEYTGTFEICGELPEIYQVKCNFDIRNSQNLKGASGSVVVFNDLVVGCLEEHNDNVPNKLYIASFPYCYQKNLRFKEFVNDHILGAFHYFGQAIEMFAPDFSDKINGCRKCFLEIKKYLNVDVSGQDVQEFLKIFILNWTAKDGLFELEKFLLHAKEKFFPNLKNQSEEIDLWNSWVELTAALAKWLLLLSLRPKYRERGRSFNLKNLKLRTPKFFEVIVSSQLMRCPEYLLIGGNIVRPGSEVLNPFAIYDAEKEKSLSVRAIYEYLFADLRGGEVNQYVNNSDDELVDFIVSDVLNKTDKMSAGHRFDGNCFIYYVIGKDSFELIENDQLFLEITDQLGGLLQFVIVEEKNKKSELKESKEGRNLANASYFFDSRLLLILADIMKLKITTS